MFSYVAAISGTLSGKILVGATVAAASLSGAYATGVADGLLSFETATSVETVGASLEEPETDRTDGDLPHESADAVTAEDEQRDGQLPPESPPPDLAGRLRQGLDPSEEQLKRQHERSGEPEPPAEVQVQPEIEPPPAPITPEPEPLDPTDPVTISDPEPLVEPETSPPPEPASPFTPEVIALEVQLARDLAAVGLALTERIGQLDAELYSAQGAMEEVWAPLYFEYQDMLAVIDAEIEATDDEARRAELTAESEAVWAQAMEELDAVNAPYIPVFEAIEQQRIDVIESSYAELSRLSSVFKDEVKALGGPDLQWHLDDGLEHHL